MKKKSKARAILSQYHALKERRYVGDMLSIRRRKRMTKRYYPPDLSRYAPRVRASMIRRWHALQTERRDWFVCPQHIEFGRAYYCDGERPQVDWHEVYDCNWTPEQWRSRPYKRVYNPVLDATFE